jgi:uncharacterized phage-like protein YoqJ
MRDLILEKQQVGEVTLISGGALGIDQMWMQVGLALRVPVIAALPFEGFHRRWPQISRVGFFDLVEKCSEVVYVCDQPSLDAYQLRNQWMVNNGDLLVGYWNGSDGGTANCIQYARDQALETLIFNPNEL